MYIFSIHISFRDLCYYFPARYTSFPETSTVASTAMTTESLTKSTALAATFAPAISSATSAFVLPITPGANPSFQQTICTLVSAITSPEICPCLQSSAGTNSTLATEVTAALLDDNLVTCMRPFQRHSQLHLSINTHATRGSSLLRIQVTGEGWDCLQPTTLVYLDFIHTHGTAKDTQNITKRECPFAWSDKNADPLLVTCTYECRPAIPNEGPLRFGVLVQRLRWSGHHLGKLCNIRAFVWI